jgi:hypothetical protein
MAMATKMVMVMATRVGEVAGNKTGNGDGGKSNGDSSNERWRNNQPARLDDKRTAQ